MSTKSIFSITEDVLLKSGKYNSSDGKLLRNKVMEASEKMDPELLSILLSDKNLNKIYFTNVNGVFIFDKQKFSWIIQNKNFLPDSYTRFKNKIGLINDKGEFILNSHDVELVFPYKDCILEGGQTKEDQKKEEIFYNETLAPDQVTNLLAPKAFCNAKKYDEKGCHKVSKITNEDNLIIKGNNLLALSSLLERYRGTVKCIYIDPPYNTGSDSFQYNDSFNHSTWLTFMKNRLEIAKRLLTNDGVILVQIDQDEGHYLKVLMDEVFDRENFRNEIIWSYRTGGASQKTTLPKKHDVILCYSKNDSFVFNGMKERQYLEKSFMGSLKDSEGRFYVDTLLRDVLEGIIKVPCENGEIHEYNVRPVLNLSSERIENFQSQKPEGFISLLLDLTTKTNDLILDFHLGSGTTAAVAHKMGRRYIGVEQLDYGKNDSVIRLKNVIKGDLSGISKSVNWQGGGSFIYCELAKLNQNYIEKIKVCKTDSEIKKITKDILASDFISTKVVPSEINIEIDDYSKLTLNEKKKFAIELLDKNQLYVNYSERNDKNMLLSKEDINFSESFYGENK